MRGKKTRGILILCCLFVLVYLRYLGNQNEEVEVAQNVTESDLTEIEQEEANVKEEADMTGENIRVLIMGN